MNRLILVGNGFDLAHGLKTSYKNFIDDFWKEVISKLNLFESDHLLFSNEFVEISQDSLSIKNISDFKELVKDYTTLKTYLSSKKIKFYFHNHLFKILSETNSNQNWVDIENVYYKELKKFEFSRIRDYSYSSVDELNTDFKKIKFFLENYLLKIDKNLTLNEKITNNITSEFKIKDILSSGISKFSDQIIKKCKSWEQFEDSVNFNSFPPNLKYFIHNINLLSPIDQQRFILKYFDNLDTSKKQIEQFYPEKILVLNFNYTKTTTDYIKKIKENNRWIIDHDISEIHIHGELKNEENPIIFGFGDDVDKKYQEFEDLNDNRYLENFKSIAYLQTDNYKKLLDFIDSEEYQIFIFGHSCGISDRTMLNTIFEHDNCKSIKPFYHLKEDRTDNYTEIVQNISRNFNDKKKYRDRIVNKTYCKSLT